MECKNADFEWAVIGAGPAGIAAVGKLIDNKVNPENILWIDAYFLVGDFGRKWRAVPSNTRVNLFLKFLYACKSFHYSDCREKFALHSFAPDANCELHFMVEALLWVTQILKKQVCAYQAWVQQLVFQENEWQIILNSNEIFRSPNVILAIGAEPKTLECPVEKIPLEIALDPNQLVHCCNQNETIGVFGSSHSAILILRNLLEFCSVKRVFNFYETPLRYAIYLPDKILFDNRGLKGIAAEWAKKNIDGDIPKKLQRVISNQENLDFYLPLCHKVICAVGFQKRCLMVNGLKELNYDSHTGMIAPGLYGVGIAFPESRIDEFGELEYRIGLWKFMEYLDRVIPCWLEKSSLELQTRKFSRI